jgi:hypothetical protein
MWPPLLATDDQPLIELGKSQIHSVDLHMGTADVASGCMFFARRNKKSGCLPRRDVSIYCTSLPVSTPGAVKRTAQEQ